MTEHKFTDEELQKCMECCIKAGCWGDCEDMSCPASTHQGCRFYLRTDEDYEGVIQDEMLKDAIDLINRQKAEVAYWMDAAANAKKEAIGSFAERLKKYYASLGGKTAAVGVEYHVDQIAKEMVGD